MTDASAPTDLSPAERAKRAAAARALNYVETGMTLGLGTGSTADWMVRLLAERMKAEGLRVIGVPTSTRTAAQASALGIPLSTLDDAGWLDLTIDGADEFDDARRLIKGGGGALLQEKIVAAASDRMVVITDPSKHVERLGAFPLPVEVVRFGHETTARLIARVLDEHGLGGRRIALRGGPSGAFVSDEGHHILDLHLGAIPEPERLNTALNVVPGVVETGLFCGIASAIVVGYEDGTARVIGEQ
ncbi:ribose-5-phosphate isomerase RpiA [Limibaculum sp. M0105]|uniref:Ribose-5-phosphate isomerase A n=1 Tax=Thermohalobaculum xanthum TaxID=2753746 RepID=A0A8J7MAQ6_9RHOB|nr:ribose-5-phosphate isomerase RpiA [Thermohalobaculum xanthum]MBK0400833.1 ribose-5-phosphate isomerase RpiA [Thermohalobaculum xanthum]